MGPVIRDYRPEDQDSVLRLHSRTFGQEAARAFGIRWDWQFYRNPANSTRPSKLWVVEYSDDVVGFLGVYPVRYKVFSETHVVYHTCDLMVAPEARGLGLGRILMERGTVAQSSVFSSGFVPAGGPIHIRSGLGSRSVSLVPLYVLLLRPRAIIENAISSGKLPTVLGKAPVSWILEAGVRSLETLTDAAVKFVLHGTADNVLVDYASSPDGDFDSIWDEVSPEIPLVAVRDQTWVQWRFWDDPVHEHVVMVARTTTGAPVGYLAWCVSTRGRTRTARIMDVFCPPRTPEVSRALLSRAISALIDLDVDMVTCRGLNPAIRRQLHRALVILPGRKNRPSQVRWYGNPELEDVAYDPNNWHVTQADSDIGFSP